MPQPEKKIPIDKEFLDKILKSVTDMKDEIAILKEAKNEPTAPPPKVAEGSDAFFFCTQIRFNASPLENEMQRKQALEIWQLELLNLMKKHKIGSVHALILKNQI